MAFGAADRELLYTEIAKLLQAGFSIDSAAETLLDQNPPPAQRTFATHLRDRLAAGASISEAVGTVPLPITDLEKTLIRAGERGGRLEDAFAHLAQYYELLAKTRRQIIGRMVYPVVLLHFAVALPAIPLGILHESSPLEIFLSICLQLVALYFIVALVVAGAIALGRIAERSAPLDGALSRIPGIGKTRQSLALARFCRVFEIYLLAGLRTSDGFQAGADAARSGSVSAAAAAITPAIEEGCPLGPMLRERPAAFPPALARSLATAEEAGTLDRDLHRWAILMDGKAAEALDRVGDWLPKILYFAVLGYVAWRIIAAYMDIMINPLRSVLEAGL